MHASIQRLDLTRDKIKEIVEREQLKIIPQIIAITKTFSLSEIVPLIKMGHTHYGENKIQEAEDKWMPVKNKYKNLKLHMVGKLQSNKAKKAVKLFDYIHSLDNVKLAKKLSQYEKELDKKIKFFIQVNIAEENEKSGIFLNELSEFYNYCTKQLYLNVIGLMVLPPINENPDKYFKILKKRASELHLTDLSMGMSTDYKQAILNGSTFLRLGTAIFGKRNS
jgi:pyridoxal phosphate enzyme (YggS family)